MPEGEYDVIRFEKSGLTSSEILDVVVTSGNTMDIGTIVMSLSTGPSGAVSNLNNAVSYKIDGEDIDVLTDDIVQIDLVYDTRAVLMKIAHESSFLNVDWVPVDSSYLFTAATNSSAINYFSTDGRKAVYVKFADINSLESSLYFHEFFIDTEKPTETSTFFY
jgi:hypothetical protein